MDTNPRVATRAERQGSSLEQSAAGEGRIVSRETGTGSEIADLQGSAETALRALQIVQLVQTRSLLHLHARCTENHCGHRRKGLSSCKKNYQFAEIRFAHLLKICADNCRTSGTRAGHGQGGRRASDRGT